MAKYTIGVDYGSLSGRALLVEVASGREIISSSMDYPHAVMDTTLPDGTRLGLDWALQHPRDYLDVLGTIVPALLEKSGVASEDIIGVGVDFTACTVLPVKADGTPLCFLPQFHAEPNAYPKLWKHHAAQDKANRITEIARQRGERFLQRYGGKVSSEWLYPKIWQTLDEAPDVYAAADFFIEAGDWIVWQMTGALKKNSCMAGYKAFWNKRDGYPSRAFFAALDPRLENFIEDKMPAPVTPLGQRAGEISAAGEKLTGLREGTAVAVAHIDAHVTVPAVQIESAGSMLAIMGTSTCHIVLSDVEREVPGMCGMVEDGILPGIGL